MNQLDYFDRLLKITLETKYVYKNNNIILRGTIQLTNNLQFNY